MALQVTGVVQQEVTLRPGLVSMKADLKVRVEGAAYDIGGQRGDYAGVLEETVTANATTYLYLDQAGTLQKNTTGYPTDALICKLARVVTSSSIIQAIYDDRVLLSSSSASVGACSILYPVDGGIRSSVGTSASSNNDIGAVRFDYNAASDGYNRWNCRPPQNRTSGNLTLRLLCSVPSDIGNNKDTKWTLEWSFRSIGDALGSWTYSATELFDVSNQNLDELFALDFTINGTSQFDASKDMWALKLTRLCTDSADNCDVHIYVHEIELRYTGYRVAGQAGQ